MISIHAHFDGSVIVPHERVDLPCGRDLIVRIEPAAEPSLPQKESCLDWLIEHAVDSPVLPPDLSLQHDHYLYGTLKRKT